MQGPFFIAAMVAGFDSPTAFWLQMAGAVSGTVGQAFTSPIMIVGLALQYDDAPSATKPSISILMLAALDARTVPQEARV